MTGQKNHVKSLEPDEIQLSTNVEQVTDKQTNTFISLAQQEQPTQTHSYRADIDGLRTIAIAIVLIFHGFPDFMTGGFIGVDVFFVISGYLISGIIIKQARKNAFSYTDFYSRRVKRIYPALILVLIFVLWMANSHFDSRRLKMTARTMAASTVFGANIEVLTYEKGYLDPDTQQNPLLHLWSLGVEEQFYIVWPWVLTVLLGRFKSSAFLLLSVFTLASFVFGIACIYQNAKFAFYFPICRFWQMSVGGLIVFCNLRLASKSLKHVLSVVGTIAILTAVWILDEQSLFPGWWALVPTLASGAILQAGPEALVNRHVLSSRVFVFVGKVSYPLYLWHWPLLVFSAYLYPKGSESIFANTYYVLGLAFLLSVGTYFVVENKVRFRKQKKVVVILVAIMVLIGLTCLVVYNENQKGSSFKIDSLQILEGDSQEVKFIKRYMKAFIPGEEDFYVDQQKKKKPNSSKNPRRVFPTVQMLKATPGFPYVDPDPTQLGKRIEADSKYYEPVLPHNTTVFEVLNQGSNHTLFVLGDSHARFSHYRLNYLHELSVNTNQIDSFPTIIAFNKQDTQFLPTAGDYPNFAQNYIKKHKPDRVLFSHRWLGYWRDCRNCKPGVATFSKEHLQQIETQVEQYASMMKELIELGIEVYAVAIHLEDELFSPGNLYDANGVIRKNIGPIRLSKFRDQFKQVIQRFEPAMQKVGVKLIYLSDNHCWEDLCYQLIPAGYPAFIDTNHYGKLYGKYWASAVDSLVEF